MKFIQGQSRDQINLFPVSLDRSIDPDNEVRIIDLFVDSLSLKDYGFRLPLAANYFASGLFKYVQNYYLCTDKKNYNGYKTDYKA